MHQIRFGFAPVSVHFLGSRVADFTLTTIRLVGTIRVVSTTDTRKWLSGRASPCQGEGREFESRLPLPNGPIWGRFFMPAIMVAGGEHARGTGGMADAAVLKTVGATRAGSSPAFRTIRFSSLAGQTVLKLNQPGRDRHQRLAVSSAIGENRYIWISRRASTPSQPPLRAIQ